MAGRQQQPQWHEEAIGGRVVVVNVAWYELLDGPQQWQQTDGAGPDRSERERRKIRQGKKRTTVRRQEASCIFAGGRGTELQFLLALGCCLCHAALLTNNYLSHQCLWVRRCRYHCMPWPYMAAQACHHSSGSALSLSLSLSPSPHSLVS